MSAKFEISKDHAGKFRFHLKAPNGEIIAASQGYESKANAEKGIEAIKKPPNSTRRATARACRHSISTGWPTSTTRTESAWGDL